MDERRDENGTRLQEVHKQGQKNQQYRRKREEMWTEAEQLY